MKRKPLLLPLILLAHVFSSVAESRGGEALTSSPNPVGIGFDLVHRSEAAWNLDLDDCTTGGASDRQSLLRLRPSLVSDPAWPVQVLLEGQVFVRGSEEGPAGFALHRGFVRGRLPGSTLPSFVVGRQEFSYGSNFMLGSDTFNDGLSRRRAAGMESGRRFFTRYLRWTLRRQLLRGNERIARRSLRTWATGRFDVDIYGLRDGQGGSYR